MIAAHSKNLLRTSVGSEDNESWKGPLYTHRAACDGKSARRRVEVTRISMFVTDHRFLRHTTDKSCRASTDLLALSNVLGDQEELTNTRSPEGAEPHLRTESSLPRRRGNWSGIDSKDQRHVAAETEGGDLAPDAHRAHLVPARGHAQPRAAGHRSGPRADAAPTSTGSDTKSHKITECAVPLSEQCGPKFAAHSHRVRLVAIGRRRQSAAHD